MLKSLWNELTEKATTIGGSVEDADLRTQKTVLVLLSLAAIPIGLVWAPIEFSMGNPGSGIATAIIAALVLINFSYFALKKNYSSFRVSQLLIFLSFPVLLHLSVGGFTKSANLIWGLATPLIALLSSKEREGVPWFIAFTVLVAAMGLVDPFLFPEGNLTVGTALFEFSFNIINASVIVFLMLLYFVRQKNRAFDLLSEEEQKSERLLLNVLPKEIAPALKSSNKTIADRFDHASILFADLVDFTPLSSEMTPEEMVDLLNRIFSHFDTLVANYDLEKIRTIGDNYMVASGVPRPRADHAHAIGRLALDIIDYIKSLPAQGGRKIDFRVGINSGSVVAGVIGKHRFHYDLWGDPVNTASRMESQGVAGRVQITSATRKLIQDQFTCEPRGRITVKGKGEMETWFLTGVR